MIKKKKKNLWPNLNGSASEHYGHCSTTLGAAFRIISLKAQSEKLNDITSVYFFKCYISWQMLLSDTTCIHTLFCEKKKGGWGEWAGSPLIICIQVLTAPFKWPLVCKPNLYIPLVPPQRIK